jgi:hypothetical protein
MNLRFEINTLEDAHLAARTCQNIVLAFGGDVQPLPAATARRRARVESADTAGLVAEPIADELAAAAIESAATDSAFSRAEVESYVKAQAVERGIFWARTHVFEKYQVRKPSDLSNEQLVELAAHMKATESAS